MSVCHCRLGLARSFWRVFCKTWKYSFNKHNVYIQATFFSRRGSSSLPCGTPWPSFCFWHKPPVGPWRFAAASPPPAVRRVCRNIEAQLSFFPWDARCRHVPSVQEKKKIPNSDGGAALPLSSLVHFRHGQLPLLCCADLYINCWVQPGISCWKSQRRVFSSYFYSFIFIKQFIEII